MFRIRPSLLILILTAFAAAPVPAQSVVREFDSLSVALFKHALASGQAYGTLRELTSTVGHRLSGSPQAARAVEWAERVMKEAGLENVHREPCMVPHWVRGAPEQAAIVLSGGKRIPVKILALGGSIATPEDGVTAEVIEVHSLKEAVSLGERAKGKIIFYNRPFDRTKFDTFEGYGGAVDQRGGGARARWPPRRTPR